jgi:hypothetical protein
MHSEPSEIIDWAQQVERVFFIEKRFLASIDPKQRVLFVGKEGDDCKENKDPLVTQEQY